MKAVRLEAVGSPLQIREIEIPQLVPGSALVRVRAAPVLSFAHRVFSGKQVVQAPPVPYTPGCGGIAEVTALASDVHSLQLGDLVFCDPRYAEPLASGGVAALLIGWFGLSEAAEPLVERWKQGTFAEYALFPAECLTALPEALRVELPRLTVLNSLTIACGALLRGACSAGDVVVVNGATGNLGAAAVVLALAFGAARVVAVGRDTATLSTLTALDPRVTAVNLGNADEEYAGLIRARLPVAGADLVVDAAGGAPPDSSLACIRALRPRGTAVWMGSVDRPVPLDFGAVLGLELNIRGSFMYERGVPARVAAMLASGLVSLKPFTVETFPLADAERAVRRASELHGLQQVALTPESTMKA